MTGSHSIASLMLSLPLFTVAPFFGLFPLVTGPALIFFLTVITLLGFSLKKGLWLEAKNNRIDAFVIFLFTAYLVIRSSSSDSYVFERSLALASAALYGCLIFQDRDLDKSLLKFALIGGSLFLSVLSLAASFTKALHPIYIALANANALALQLTMVIPITLEQCLLMKKQKASRAISLFYILILITQLIALIFTKAQGMIAVAILSFILGSNTSPKKKWSLALALIAFFLSHKFFFDPKAISDRWQWWQTAFAIFRDYPLLGSAHEGGFLRLYPLYKGTPSASQSTMLTHNLYLEFLSDFGLLGCGFLLMTIWAIRKKSIFDSWALRTSLIVVFLSGFFDSSHFFLPNMLNVWAVSGLAREKGANQALPQTSRLSFLPLGLALIFCAFTISQSFRLSVGRGYLFWGELKLSAETLQAREVNQAHQIILKSLHWDKKNPYTWVDLMKIELLKQNPLGALEASREAARLDPLNKIYQRNIEIIRQRLGAGAKVW